MPAKKATKDAGKTGGAQLGRNHVVDTDVADRVPTPIMAVDDSFSVTYINDAGARLFGKRPDDMLGRKCYDFFRTPQCRTADCACDRAMRTGRTAVSVTVADPDGINLPIRYTGTPLLDANGQVEGAIEFVVDIASEKRVQSSIADELGEAVREVSDRTGEMKDKCLAASGLTSSVATAAETLAGTMTELAAGAEQSGRSVSSVASATEEMTATVSDIAENAERARLVSDTAVKSVSVASERVDSLDAAAKEISNVTDTIVEIAEQTKLLALNATIEAARAGEAGKGYAVVASEVKELAKQTNSATKDIRARIEAIQEATESTISEIKNITRVIDEVSEFVSTIAVATEQQSVTTKDIAGTVSEVAVGVSEMSENVARAADVTGDVTILISGVNDDVSSIKAAALAMNQAGDRLRQTRDSLIDQAAAFDAAG